MTKCGMFMYNLTLKLGGKIMKRPWLYYLLNYTWGLLYTVLGWLIALFFLPFSKVKKYNFTYYLKTRFSGGWGIGLGVIFGVAKEDYLEKDDFLGHEFGHTVQNAIFGPFFLLLIGIPSFIRCQYRSLKYTITKKPLKTFYDSIWFEGSATILGSIYTHNIKGKVCGFR